MLKRFMPWKGKIFDIAPHTPSGIVKEKKLHLFTKGSSDAPF